MERPPPWSYGGAASPGSGSFYPPIYFLTNPNTQFPGNLQYVQLPPSNPQPVFQNPRAVQPQNPSLRNPGLPIPKSSQRPLVTLEGVESAVTKAHRDILTTGEYVSAWKVSQSALVALKVDSWSSLGFQLQQVPTLNRLLLIEGKVNAFIHCFVCARKITSMYDLEVCLCKNEGVRQFEELGLGPFLQHPLVKHYFSVTSDSTEVFKITSEEIILSLQTFMSKFKKEVSVEAFLSFLAQQKSIPVKEKLGIRIQNLGFHVYHMRKASKAENSVLREKLIGSVVGSGKIEVIEKIRGSQPPSIALEKQVLDKRFDYISSCVKSFSSKLNDSGGKHVYFTSSDESDDTQDVDGDDEDDGKDNTSISQNQRFSHGQGRGQHVSSCPYPSKAEEIIRLGLKLADTDKASHASCHITDKDERKFSRRKRKLEENNKSACSSCKFLKRIEAVDLEGKLQLPDLTLSNGDIEKFATTWKEACRGHSVAEVFDMMLSFYVEAAKQRRKIRKVVSSYPVIGLLNVAIMSIKRGMLESLYDTFQALNEKEPVDMDSGSAEMIDVRPIIEDSIPIITMGNGFGVNTDDIIKKIANYFENYLTRPRERGLSLEKQLASLKKLHDCERWLMAQFNVQEFSSLGHGNFYDFLEKHISILSHEMHAVLYKEHFRASSVEVCLLEQQLGIMLTQAEGNLVTEVDGSGFDIVSLLKRQFPAACFHMVGLDPEKYFEDLTNRHKESGNSSCVLFSMCLLGDKWTNFLVRKENSSVDIRGMETEITQQYLYRRSSKDAIECLLKAPMLSDLLHWSHWDLLYASSLGSLPEWLLNNVNHKELLCIATADGKLIRVDHSATMDEFLEALVQCSSFHAALKFLSLLCLYRGTRNAPLALLKCYAQKAVNVVMGNFTDSVEISGDGKSFTQGKIVLSSSSSFSGVPNYSVEQYNQNSVGSTVRTSLCRVKNAIAAVSKTILGCLQYLPSEFRSFAADILVSGFRSVIKQAPVAILNECTQPDERIMLHDIGLLLCVTEWVIDHHQFSSSTTLDLSLTSTTVEGSTRSFSLTSVFDPRNSVQVFEGSTSGNQRISLGTTEAALVIDGKCRLSFGVDSSASTCRMLKEFDDSDEPQVLCEAAALSIDISEEAALRDATAIVESIRCEEFGLDSNSNKIEDHVLKKQHARLGRALHCLSQELYSQDSHFILELVQNADDNMYPDNLEPELVFILQEAGIVVLNNETGFSAANIRALCDIGNSTKKGSSGGYIGKKGIGFKSVFRVTDAPEIHSNGFHVKFDITEGQIGFILPTVISPCNVNTFKQYLCDKDYQGNTTAWNTCILLPFRSQSKGVAGVSSIISMFSDLHPSLLLFLHHLRCIKFKNLLSDELVVMRKETLHNGIVKVSHGKEVMSWLVISKKLWSSVVRTDIEATDISIAFTLQESDDGGYKPCLSYQPVFSFLPLRNYGLKFILQGDFVLPSSREEVDGDSAWNQWLLSEFPSLFVSAEQSFCALPCFLKSPGKALTIYMSFVPLVGEVHGFFSQLPHMIISLLRISKCLLQDTPELTWVLPCRVLRGCNEQARLLLSDHLLQRHLGLVYMHKDVKLSDTLARALGIRDYGPKVLVEVVASLCHSSEDLESLGLDWLSAWLAAVHSTLSMHFSGHSSSTVELGNDVINDLRYIPFIPLSDGSYGCLAHGPIWLPCDVGSTGEYHPEDFPCLYTKLQIVTPHLFTSATKSAYIIEEIKIDIIMEMLLKIGVQQLSAHEVIRSHILVALSEMRADDDRDMMIEYLSFIMHHFQFDCGRCHSEKADIILELQKVPVLLTNYGYKYPFIEPIHFGREYGNPIDIAKLFDAVDIKWVEVDPSYLKHPSTKPLPSGLTKWRTFFLELGVTDFVQVTCTNKNTEDFLSENKMNNGEFIAATSYVKDWESPELVNLLSAFSSKKFRAKCMYLLEVLDKMWDDCYSAQARSSIVSKTDDVKKPIVSSFMNSIHDFAWIASTIDEDLYQPKSLFYDCEQVHSVLGTMAAYAFPQVNSKLLVKEIGFKMEVSIDDAAEILQFWRLSGSPFVASISQMLNFYTFISNGIVTSSSKIIKELTLSRCIFIPFISSCQSNAPASGLFVSPTEVYWQDPTGTVDRVKELMPLCTSTNKGNHIPCLALATVYPSLHDFFVNTCCVPDTPPFGGYFQILQQLSEIALPSQAAHNVFRVMVRWANDLKSGVVCPDQISELKENFLKLENTVLPTELDKWVSLHPSFGLICWSDDDELKKQFKHTDGVDFIHFGDLSMEECVMLSGGVSTLLHIIGVPALSEIVSREAIFYGSEDNTEKVSLVNWVFPYAQRYIYKLHLDTYLKLKQLGFEKINQLQVVVVSKLFYKYTLQGRGCDSKGRFECNCLLQGSTLYAYKATDSHSIFSELSRFFFNGSAELHFANFLHMVTTMAESGSSNEQIEFFIVNSQKLPKLPDEEPLWSLSSLCDVDLHTISLLVPDHPVPSMDHETRISKSFNRKPGISTNWPPTDWKTAPDFNSSIIRYLRPRPWIPCSQDDLCKAAEDIAHMQDPVSVEITGSWTLEEGSIPESTSMLQDSQLDSVGMHENSASESTNHLEDPNDVSGQKTSSLNPAKLLNRDRITWRFANEQMRRTGRLGEMIVYKYFSEKLSFSDVKWVNEETETGLPYDLVVGVEESRQYIEVKATSSATKDWFDITTREWLFAAEKGDSYSIAHVAIFGPNKATVTILKNPCKLCQQNVLSLALLMSRRA